MWRKLSFPSERSTRTRKMHHLSTIGLNGGVVYVTCTRRKATTHCPQIPYLSFTSYQTLNPITETPPAKKLQTNKANPPSTPSINILQCLPPRQIHSSTLIPHPSNQLPTSNSPALPHLPHHLLPLPQPYSTAHTTPKTPPSPSPQDNSTHPTKSSNAN